MADIMQYRSRIGLFSQRPKSFKFLYISKFYNSTSWNEDKSGKIAFNATKSMLKIILLLTLLTPSSSSSPPLLTRHSTGGGVPSTTSSLVIACWSECYVEMYDNGQHGRKTGNFWARYLYGNRRVKGVQNMHFNIRSLKYKMGEVKNILKQEKPQIFGLSDTEIKKETIDEKILKVPGYNILFPKSWDLYGFARVVVYVKKNFQYEQVRELEDDVVQSV